jgi:hypothetical protein
VVKHAASLGFVLSNFLDAGLDSINNRLRKGVLCKLGFGFAKTGSDSGRA